MSNEQRESIQDKSYRFAVHIVETYRNLVSDHKEYILSKQLVRSGTSIGANAEEATGGISRKEFKFKLGISYKEARETKYWLRLLHDTGYLDSNSFKTLFKECDEILRILYTILKNTKG